MEWTPAVVMAFLLGVSSVLSIAHSNASLRPPHRIRCVFIERVKATCRWEHNKTSSTNYNLSIWDKRDERKNGFPGTYLMTCRSTDTWCTIAVTDFALRVNYCVQVTAHVGNLEISSDPRCQPGRVEAKLKRAALRSVTPLQGFPQCLIIKSFEPDMSEFPMSLEEIREGDLNSQIEFKAQGEHHGEVKNVNVTGFAFTTCGFRPDTSYNIRLRQRYKSDASPWSEWSSWHSGRTEEAAPSVAPLFWMQAKESIAAGWRRVTLLWKPVNPFRANGRIRFYNVTCQTNRSLDLNNLEECTYLDETKTSCSLHLPVEPCSCGLTASTARGISPEARLWLRGASEQGGSAPREFLAIALNDSSMEVGWLAPARESVSGFVVEWFTVRENSSSILHWEKLNRSTTTLVITEGIKPMERYAVSVRALYGKRGMAGENDTRLIYTREGTPSAGPLVTVNKIYSDKVELSWSRVPVEELHGFLQNYTVYITDPQKQTRKVPLPSHSTRYILKNLSPGNYKFSMGANTGGGAGPAGVVRNVYIAAETPILLYALIALAVTTLLSALLFYLTCTKIVKKKQCKYVPDPASSTLSHWTPNDIKEKQLVVPEKLEVMLSDVVLLKKEENFDLDLKQSDQKTCNIEIYSSETSPPKTDITQNVLLKRLAGNKTSSVLDLFSHPSSLSDVSYTPASNNPSSTPLLCSSYQQLSCVDTNQPPGGALEPFAPFPKLFQSLCSLSSVDSPARSTMEPMISSLKQKHCPSSFKPFLSLYSISSATPSAPSASFQPISVDLSYCPVQCDPHIPSHLEIIRK